MCRLVGRARRPIIEGIEKERKGMKGNNIRKERTRGGMRGESRLLECERSLLDTN